MGKINQLTPNVFNMIAAGEVVERPASVVKELVENSIDAGATAIDVIVVEGGIRKITVSDNGVGILPEDIRTAFMPHATSKLKEITDLDTLSSLGFRGEALASVASVSEVTLISRAKGQEQARKIALSAGKITLESADSRAAGTIITVENLFFNTPARAKFLKTPVAEQKAVEAVIEKLALSNPEIAFSLSDREKELFRQEGGTLADSVTSVFGAEVFSHMLEINSASGNISVVGFTTKTDYSKPSRAWQTLIVNGRAVENRDLSLAIDRAYEGRLVKRNYPACVLQILVPFDDVDVNVHPRKAEVRFRDKNAVFGAVYHAVTEVIDRENLAGDLGFLSVPTKKTETAKQDEVPAENFGYRRSEAVQTRIDTSSLYRSVHDSAVGNYRRQTEDKSEFDAIFGAKSSENGYIGGDDADYGTVVGGRSADEPATDYNSELNNANMDFANSYGDKLTSRFDGKIIGQIFDTFIVVERDDVVYLIDQHAAHERLLYEKLVSKLGNENYVQSLLVPYKFKLSGAEAVYFEKIIPALKEIGFDIDKKLGNYFFYSVPEAVARMDFDAFLGELFKNMLSDGDVNMKELIHDQLCRQACKAAIKGGDALNREQIEATVSSLLDENGEFPKKCPHGRPAVVAVSKTDVEKLFKRIV